MGFQDIISQKYEKILHSHQSSNNWELNQENIINDNILPTRLAMCSTGTEAENMGNSVYHWEYKLVPSSWKVTQDHWIHLVSLNSILLIQKFQNYRITEKNIQYPYPLPRSHRC